MQKKKKSEEREKAELELQKMREDAAQLAELNVNLQRELNLARQSHFGASDPSIPSTLAASVGGPQEQGVPTTKRGICSLTSGVVASVPPIVAMSMVWLQACGM